MVDLSSIKTPVSGDVPGLAADDLDLGRLLFDEADERGLGVPRTHSDPCYTTSHSSGFFPVPNRVFPNRKSMKVGSSRRPVSFFAVVFEVCPFLLLSLNIGGLELIGGTHTGCR